MGYYVPPLCQRVHHFVHELLSCYFVIFFEKKSPMTKQECVSGILEIYKQISLIMTIFSVKN